MLPQGISLVFANSEFTSEIRSLNIELARESYELTTFNELYKAMDRADLVSSQLNLTIAFDPDVTPPIDQDVERIDLTWPKSGNQTRGPLWYFEGFFMGYEPEAVVDELMIAQVEIKITGPITYRTGTRGFRIAPSGQADYTSSTTAAQLRYGWIADSGTQQLSNGDDPYLIMPRGSS